MIHKTLNQSILLAVLLGMSITGFISIDIFSPSLPSIVTSFQISIGMGQFSITLYLIGFCLSQLIYGPISDYFGRRPSLVLGSSIYFLGSFICYYSYNINWLLFGRVLQGLGAGAGASLSRIILRDLFIGQKLAKTTSILTIGVVIATAIAPAAGGVIQQYYGYQGNFMVMLILAFLMLMSILTIIPETNSNRLPLNLTIKTAFNNFALILINKNFSRNFLCSGMVLSCIIAYVSISPFLLQSYYHLSAAIYGAVCLLILCGEFFGAMINIKLLNQYDSQTICITGLIILLISGILLICLRNTSPFSLIQLIVYCFFLHISMGLILPNTSAAAFSIFETKLGYVGAAYGFGQHLITTSLIFIVSCLGVQSQFGLGVLIIFAASISLLLYRK